jgi:PhnB protein
MMFTIGQSELRNMASLTQAGVIACAAILGAVKAIPDGWHSVTPRLLVHNPKRLVDFLKAAFGATGDYESGRPSQVKIGDSLVMVSGVTGFVPSAPAYLYLYIEDCDAVYARAIAAGATSLEAPEDLHYGDRRATIRDPEGNVWQIGTHKEDVPPAELARRLAKTSR